MTPNETSANKLNGRLQSFIIAQYPEYEELMALRKKGWQNPDADIYFQRQRHRADSTTPASPVVENREIGRQCALFRDMMCKMARNMDQATSVFSGLTSYTDPDLNAATAPRLLDICMAPGGFSQYFLQTYADGHIRGLSLPSRDGGHKLWMKRDLRVKIWFVDITLLAAEMDVDVSDIPFHHPDRGNFVKTKPYGGEQFELVICDGQVLRTHGRPEYRETAAAEASRLLTSQLVLALQRIRKGGSLVLLLHKVERVETMILLYTFSKFSRLTLFKSSQAHAIRSSFYLIAKDVQSGSIEALEAVKSWKRSWRALTLNEPSDEHSSVQKMEEIDDALEHFGEEYICLGRPIWEIQRRAL